MGAELELEQYGPEPCSQAKFDCALREARAISAMLVEPIVVVILGGDCSHPGANTKTSPFARGTIPFRPTRFCIGSATISHS